MSIWDDHPKASIRVLELNELFSHKYGDIATKLNEEFHVDCFSYGSVKGKIQRSSSPKEEIADVKSQVLKLIEKERTKSYICQLLQISVRILFATLEDLKDEGYLIDEFGDSVKLRKVLVIENNIHESDWKGNQIIKIGVISDTHLCSNDQQVTLLNEMYDIFLNENIKDVYHAGDLCEGDKMRKGHEYELFKHGVDEQTEYIVNNYPTRQGIKTNAIAGNHDLSHIVNSGYNIVKRICENRKDFNYLGTEYARVMITPNCSMDIVHPRDGASYAISYCSQKYCDALESGTKPHLLILGHHHKSMSYQYRSIHVIEAGTFQRQTSFMRGKRIAASVGGYVLTIHVDEEGSIKRFCSEFFPFYIMNEKDY